MLNANELNLLAQAGRHCWEAETSEHFRVFKNLCSKHVLNIVGRK